METPRTYFVPRGPRVRTWGLDPSAHLRRERALKEKKPPSGVTVDMSSANRPHTYTLSKRGGGWTGSMINFGITSVFAMTDVKISASAGGLNTIPTWRTRLLIYRMPRCIALSFFSSHGLNPQIQHTQHARWPSTYNQVPGRGGGGCITWVFSLDRQKAHDKRAVPPFRSGGTGNTPSPFPPPAYP